MNSKTKLTIKEMIVLSRSVKIEESFKAPKGLSYLPFQNVSIKWISLFDKVLIADPPGAGKTVMIAGAINNEGPKRVLIYAPASLILNWKKELTKWMINPLPIYSWKEWIAFDKKPDNFIILSSFYFAGKKESILQVLKLKTLDLLVVDEVHAFKDLKTQRTKNLMAKNGPFSIAKKVVTMTGTPIVNRPIELYPLIKRLAPQLILDKNRYEYGMKFCAGWQTPWNTMDFTGASNLKELGTALRSGFMIRREKKDILPQLPKVIKTLIYLDEKTPKSLVFKADNVNDPGAFEFTESSAIRKETGLKKLEKAIEYIETQLEAGHEKIILFAHHEEVIKGLEAAFAKFNPCKVVGGMSAQAKDDNVVRFQTDKESRIFIGSLRAAGVGLTLTAASYIIFIEADWTPGINDQAIDRAHRIGQESLVQADFLVLANTLDERILSYHFEKAENAAELFK
jgi:SWI/SNF-related matrix-associated actin-dependent regulator 1 of chromatin subfamily A